MTCIAATQRQCWLSCFEHAAPSVTEIQYNADIAHFTRSKQLSTKITAPKMSARKGWHVPFSSEKAIGLASYLNSLMTLLAP
jgi:hypothetical protein